MYSAHYSLCTLVRLHSMEADYAEEAEVPDCTTYLISATLQAKEWNEKH